MIKYVENDLRIWRNEPGTHQHHIPSPRLIIQDGAWEVETYDENGNPKLSN
jgi:hypothetical protein